jgi:hypothetical protein
LTDAPDGVRIDTEPGTGSGRGDAAAARGAGSVAAAEVATAA